jgi:mono/diheme cytochrome c family protein
MNHNKFLYLGLFMVFMVLLSACGGNDSQAEISGAEANIQAGKELFDQTIIGTQTGCRTCHSLEEGVIIVGPSLAGIGTRGAETVPGVSATEYIRKSILEPDVYLVEGFPAGTMPNVWEEQLSNEQIDNLVAYLLSLK